MSVDPIATTVLWLVPLVLQAAIAGVMVRRRLARRFPLFFSYTLAVLCREIALLFLRYGGNPYALVYWSGEALAVALGLAAVFEAVRDLLPPYPFLRILWNSVWLASALAATAALAMLTLADRSHGTDRVFEFIILAERSARFLQACVLVVVIALMSRLALTWRSYSLGILAGFGIYSGLALAVLELRAHLNLVSDRAMVRFTSAAYDVAAIIWASYFLRPRPGRRVEHLPKTSLADWNKVVTQHVDQWYRRS